jgi:putative cell wall-binding protein
VTRSIRFRLFAAILMSVGLLAPLLGPAGTPAAAVADVRTDRLGGANRFETAAAIARAGHPSAQTAIIANGTNFPDALAGSYLAGAVDAPILLVLPNAVPQATSSALEAIGVNDVVLLGGPAAVSAGVEAQLRQRYGVTRVQGNDRYQTAVEVARRGAIGGVGTVDGLRTAFLTTGQNFPDALGAGPLAYDGSLPIFLTRPDSLPGEVAQALRDLNIEHVVILGGTQAVSAGVETAVKSTGPSTERLSGRNRAETATLVADFALARLGFEGSNVILARGDDFPDALAGGPLGGVRRAVIVLTATSTQLAIETRNWLEDHFGTITRITALGGTAAVSDSVLREAEQAAETNNLPPSRVDLTISGGSMNGGPEWQYQESDASPSKSLTLSALVTSDPPEGSDESADRPVAAREDVVFNVRPTQGDNAANQELNINARTDANGVARVSYSRGQPGTDIITVRLAEDPGINDDGVGRWGTDPMPMSLAPDTAATLQAGQTRQFTACRPGPSGSATPATASTEFHLTTIELVDDDPDNNTNTAALRFSTNVTDDRADSDQTIGKVTAPAVESNGCVTFSVGSNSAQVFTLMAFLDDVVTPAANDDNTNPPEFRDAAGPTTVASSTAGLSISPANDNNASTSISRRNGQQIVYRVTSVDAQGRPSSAPVDVSFQELVDAQGATTTNAEFDWFDNSANPSMQEGTENQVPPTATATAAGTTRFEVVPNADGLFTFAVVQPASRTAPTTGTPIVWIDLPGGVNNRPDTTEPQARGENFTYATGTAVDATLEVLGCPPGTDQRGFPGDTDPVTPGVQPGNNPFDAPDPCLGMDQPDPTTAPVQSQPHVPWRLDVAAESDTSDAATCDIVRSRPAPTADNPEATERVIVPRARPSRGDVVFRFTLRDPQGRRLRDNPDTLGTTENQQNVTFLVRFSGFSNYSAAAHRPNRAENQNRVADCSAPTTAVDNNTGVLALQMQTREGVAEIVLDQQLLDDSAGAEATFATATVEVVRSGFGTQGLTCPSQTPPVGTGQGEFCRATATWADIDYDTTKNDAAQSSDAGPNSPAPPTSCPSLVIPCFNGPLVAIDKARDYYVVQRGGSRGGHGYVVYAVGGGGNRYTKDRPAPGATVGLTPADRPPDEDPDVFSGERPSSTPAGTRPADEYFIDGLRAPADSTDNLRCGFFSSLLQAGCARFEAAMSFDDRMVHEFDPTQPVPRTQTHFLTNGTAPIGE